MLQSFKKIKIEIHDVKNYLENYNGLQPKDLLDVIKNRHDFTYYTEKKKCYNYCFHNIK